MKTLITIANLFIGTIALSQATTEVKTYHDYWKTKVYGIEQKTDLGQLHGEQKYYDEEGHLRNVYQYKLGKKQGLHQAYFVSGKVAEIYNYKEDKKYGKFEVFAYENERYYLYQTGSYDNGQLINEISYHSNTKKSGIYNYNGLCTNWYESGQKYAEFSRVNDVTEGAFLAWYESGEKLLESSYVNGLQDGEWNHYGTGGNIIRSEQWLKGERVGKWKYYFTYDDNGKAQIESLADATDYLDIDHSDVQTVEGSLRKCYAASGFDISGEKLWEGYISYSKEKIRDSDFNKWIRAGDCVFYENGQKVAEGRLTLIKANTSQPESVRDGEWKYYKDGKFNQAQTFRSGSLIGN